MNNEILDIFKKDDVSLTSKFLIGVSGGPDSMYLLWHLKKLDVIVVHVNYHKRIDSDNDQKIVEEFCKTYNIPFEVLEITSHNEKGNFQAIARQERYDFYKKIYQKYNCNYLLLAHHKDDFIETGMLDSFDILTLVTDLEAAFGVKIDGGDIVPENFGNLEAIKALLVKSGSKNEWAKFREYKKNTLFSSTKNKLFSFF